MATSQWKLFYNMTKGSITGVSLLLCLWGFDKRWDSDHNCVSWNKLSNREKHVNVNEKQVIREEEEKHCATSVVIWQSVSHYWALMAEVSFLGEEGLNETAWLGLVWHYPGESNRITTGSEVNSWQTHTNTHCAYTDTADKGTRHQLSDLGPGTLYSTVHITAQHKTQFKQGEAHGGTSAELFRKVSMYWPCGLITFCTADERQPRVQNI